MHLRGACAGERLRNSSRPGSHGPARWYDAQPVDRAGTGAHHVIAVADQDFKRNRIEPGMTGPQLQRSFDTQDDAPVGAINIPLMPAIQDAAVVIGAAFSLGIFAHADAFL